jgi:NAD-dependent DNA ligase
MISLDNTYNEEDLNDFDERVKKNLDINTPPAHSSHPPQPLGTEGEFNIEYTLEFKFD